MEQLLPRELDLVFTSNWEGPLDGHDIDQESLHGFGVFPGWRIVSTNQYWSRPLKKGEIGGSVSHWLCWKDAAARVENRALFFEDDVVLVDSFLDRLSRRLQILDARHKTWDFLYLGRFPKPSMPHIWIKDLPADEGIVRPGFSYGAHAYMLSSAGLEKILSVRFEKDLIPIDEFLPALYTIHPRPDVAKRYAPILNAFALEPPIAFHLPLEQVGSDAEACDFIDW